MIGEQDRGFLLGDGVFDTMRVEDGRGLLHRRHSRRLMAALKAVGLSVDAARIEAEQTEAMASLGRETGSLRTTISRGEGPRGLLPPDDPMPTISVSAAPVGPRSIDAVSAVVSRIARNEGSPLSRIKSLSYQDQVLVALEARAAGAADAVMLNNRGEAACTSMANLLALTDEGWVTPPLSAGVLPGIVREVLIEERAVTEATVGIEDLHALPLARSNSLVGVQPLALKGGAAPDKGAVKVLTEALGRAERREQ